MLQAPLLFCAPSSFRSFASRSALLRVSSSSPRQLVHHQKRLRYPLQTFSTCISINMTAMSSTSSTATATVKTTQAFEKLSALRNEMEKLGIDVFIIPSTDAHNSEYTAPYFGRREFISDFSGSAGTAVVTKTEALLWTDGRYFLQAQDELCAQYWTLMKSGLVETPTIQEYLKSMNIENENSIVIGIDAFLHSIDFVENLKLQNLSVKLLMTGENPIDKIWFNNRPVINKNPIRTHDIKYSGSSITEKLKNLRQKMSDKKCDTVILSMLDEVAWMFNIRGNDIPHCPVVLSYAIITTDQAYLFIDEGKVPNDVKTQLEEENVTIKPYDSILNEISNISKQDNCTIWYDANITSAAIANATEGCQHIVKESTPVTLSKAIKNESELNGMRQAHIQDGYALSKFLCWLENYVNDGNVINEVEASDKLYEFRAKQKDFLTTSFETISGSGSNGAIIHYRADKLTCKNIDGDDLYLVDSGGQYINGTTDVTRTMHLKNSPSEYQKQCFTRVLKGHISIDQIVFPPNTTGLMIDCLARQSLWEVGLDYRHGTGHGVGACLNVHEGPHSIAARPGANKCSLRNGMIVSNEPGYYEDGSFGIRIENLLIVTEKETKHQFGGKPYLGLECLTWVPLDKSLIDTELLSDKEIKWVNQYHDSCWSKLSPLLSDNDEEQGFKSWLREKTRPL